MAAIGIAKTRGEDTCACGNDATRRAENASHAAHQPASHDSATAAAGSTGAMTAAARPSPSSRGIAGSASAFAGTVHSGTTPNCSHRIGAVTRPQAPEMPTISTSFHGSGQPSRQRRSRGTVSRIAATAAKESWNPGSSSERGVHASSTSAPRASTCHRSLGRDASHASDATQPAIAARTTDGCHPTASA